MKKKLLFLTLTFLISSTSFTVSQPVWTSQSSGTTSTLYAVKFTDTLTGIAVGGSGTIRKTTNGGVNWFALSGGTSNTFRSISLLSQDTGYTVGDGGVIRKTTNGGVNWFALTSGTTNHLNSVFAIDQNIVFACGNSGTIIKSTNGGINWAFQAGGTGNNFRSIHFINANTGCAVGDLGTVRRTTNGGANWFAQTVSVNGPLTAVYLNNATNGIISIGYLNMAFYRTTDGGVTWNSQFYGSDNSIRAIDFVGDFGYMGGDVGNFYVTGNGGANWSRIPMGVSNWMYGLSFATESHGWAVGTQGLILRTTTGGAITPNSPTNLVGFSISTSKIFLAWFDNSSGEQGFKIQRSLNNPSSFSDVGTVGPNILNYIDSSGISPVNTYYYRVYAYGPGGNSGYSNVVAVLLTSLDPIGAVVPDKYALYNNYPNPFNPSTKIKFDLPKNDLVSLKVYNMSGQVVALVVDQNLGAGRYEVDFDGAYLSTGTYFYRIETSSFTETKKMMLIK